jgi:hypothetical protein
MFKCIIGEIPYLITRSVYVSPCTPQELKDSIDNSFQTFSNKCFIEYF